MYRVKSGIITLGLMMLIGIIMNSVFVFADTDSTADELKECNTEGIILEDLSMEELGEYLDVETVACTYNIDPQVLLEKVYSDLHSDTGYFSPFSNIELGINNDRQNEYEISATLPYLILYQDSTMYLSTGNPCASGNYPYIGCVAVHKTSATDSTPIFPFGTAIHYQGTSVDINGTSYSDFIVEDTGDGNFVRSTYWTDVYGGDNTAENQKMAWDYGVKTVNFTWD